MSIMPTEKELVPSSKIADAYPLPSQYHNINPTGPNEHHSLDLFLSCGLIR